MQTSSYLITYSIVDNRDGKSFFLLYSLSKDKLGNVTITGNALSVMVH